MKKTLIVSSLVIIAILSGVAYRENLNMEWQKHQKRYKNELTKLAQTEQEKVTARNYKVQMRQIVLHEFNKADRCVTCHVAMEDTRMSHMPQPLKNHPGEYLETHDINRVGCTFCHDGQGRAITADDAHAMSTHKYWEKPILKRPFIEANCVRCHVNPLAQTPHYNNGKQIYKELGCITCHKIRGEGGIIGPDLSNIGNASFHVKAPVPERRKEYLEKFHENVNLAYLYESVIEPKAQPADTTMPDFGLAEVEDEALDLVTYLKSLSTKRRVMDIGFEQWVPPADVPVAPAKAWDSAAQPAVRAVDREVTTADIKRGQVLFEGKKRFVNKGAACNACHNVKYNNVIGGGSLGGDLTRIYSQMGKEALWASLEKPISPVMKKAYDDNFLTDEEILSLVAFLEDVERQEKDFRPRYYGLKLLGNGILGALLFLGIYTFYWSRRKKD